MRIRIALVGLAVAVSVAASGCASRGYKKSDNLAEDIRATAAAVNAFGISRQASFDSMNALLAEPLDNLPARFEKFNSAVDGVVSADGSLRGALATMKSAGAARFQAWGEQNRSTSDGDMKRRAEKNRTDAEDCLHAASADTESMLELATGFVTYLSDLRNMLSNDLTSKGVSSVSEFAVKARASNGALEDSARPARSSLGAAADAVTTVNPAK